MAIMIDLQKDDEQISDGEPSSLKQDEVTKPMSTKNPSTKKHSNEQDVTAHTEDFLSKSRIE